MDVKIFTVCDIKIDEKNYKKIELYIKTVTRLIEKRENNTFSRNDYNKIKVVNSVKNTNNNKKKTKVVDSMKNKNNQTFIIGFSKCGKTYRMNHILIQKQQPIFIFTKSLNQYPNTKAETSDEIHPLEHYENSTVVFDNMLLSKQESNIDLFFTRGRHSNIDIYYISQSYFHLPKNTLFVLFLI